MRRALVCLIACACARDLEVPAPAGRPVITSFSPLTAFSDQVLSIAGKNFDPVAANNVVQFTVTTARAFDYDAAGNLEVYVPEGEFVDLFGTLSVSNKNGVSEQSAQQFNYLGRGHPYLGVPVGTTRFLHRPPGIAVLGGQVVVASTVAWAVMGASGFFAQLAGEPTALAGLPDGSAAFAAAQAAVVRLTPGGPGASVDLGLSRVPFLSASPDSARLLAVGEDPLGVVHVAALAPADLSISAVVALGGSAALPGPVLGAAALDDGRAALVDAGAVTLLDPAAPEGRLRVVAPAPLSGPIAAVDSGLAVAFADGTLRVLSTGATPAWGAPISTGSAEPVATLIGKGIEVAGAKPRERLVRLLRLDTGAIEAEHIFAGTPRALAWAASRVLVADDTSNIVDEMDAATGNLTGRTSFPLRLGSTLGCGQGSAVEEDPRPEHTRYQMLSVARNTNQLFAIDYNELTLQPPMPLAAGASPVRGVVMPGVQGIWIVHDIEIGRMRDDDTEEILTSALPGAQCMLFADPAGAAAVVLRPQDVSVLRGGAITAQVAMPGAVISGHVQADGKFVLFFGDPAMPGASPKARLYTLDALEHGGAPEAEFAGTSQYQGFIGAFGTAFGPMLFFTWDAQAASAGAYAIFLDASLAAQPATDSKIPEPGVVRITPDGLYIVWRRAGDPVLQVLSTYYPTAIYGYEAYSLEGTPSAPAFDSSGQYMYVPEPDLDEIQTYQ